MVKVLAFHAGDPGTIPSSLYNTPEDHQELLNPKHC